MLPRSLSALTLAVCALAVPATASAQVSRVGDTTTLIAGLARGSAVAYDTKSDRYLVVSSHGVLWGRLVDGNGGPIGGQFQIGGTVHAHFPRVAYSPDTNGGQGGFLVVWHESDTSPTSIHARMVSSSGEMLSADTQIAPATSFWEVGAAVSYSTVSKEFLVAWRTFSPATIRGIRIGNGGTALSASFPIAAYHEYADNPNIAYNPSADEWMVVHSGYQGSAYVSAQRVKPGTGALIGGPNPFGFASAVYITDVAYNPTTNQYLAAWHTGIMLGQVLNSAGQPLGSVIPLSSRYAAYDALSVARNAISGSFFAVSHDSAGTQDGGVEISQNGQPLTAGVQVTNAGGSGNFYPRLATSTVRPDWYVSAANVFTSTIGQRITTATVSQPGEPPPPPPPPPPSSCSFALSNNSASIGQGGGNGGFSLTASLSTCAWTATPNQSWVTMAGGTGAGTGSSTIAFTVAPNPATSPRAATITVGGLTFSVTQAARTASAMRSLDFSGDNLNDIVWQNSSTGEIAIWRMRGVDAVGGEFFTPGSVADSNWKIMGTIDANRDGKRDLLWQHDSGLVAVWMMNGTTMVSGDLVSANTTGDPRWRIVATADLDLDGYEDILWQHQNGAVAVWYMRGLTMIAADLITSLSDSRWRVVGAEDFNQDGRMDLVWRHSATGETALWYMNNRTQLGGITIDLTVSDMNWEIAAISDVNSDGRPDFVWRNRVNGSLAAWMMDGARLANGVALNPGSANVTWKIVGPK